MNVPPALGFRAISVLEPCYDAVKSQRVPLGSDNPTNVPSALGFRAISVLEPSYDAVKSQRVPLGPTRKGESAFLGPRNPHASSLRSSLL